MAADDFAEFYQGTWRRIVTFVYAMSGDLAEAEDLAQEAYARTWSRWGTVRGYSDPESWVRTVAYRLYISRWRKMRNRVTAYRRHGAAAPTDPPSEDTVALVAALRDLPDVQRHAIVLHHLLDLPVAEVARQTGTSESTVKARLVRGRRAIAKGLGTEFPVEVTNA
jgi:RNA polymerase sigma-70 factor (ECF subfamily)